MVFLFFNPSVFHLAQVCIAAFFPFQPFGAWHPVKLQFLDLWFLICRFSPFFLLPALESGHQPLSLTFFSLATCACSRLAILLQTPSLCTHCWLCKSIVAFFLEQYSKYSNPSNPMHHFQRLLDFPWFQLAMLPLFSIKNGYSRRKRIAGSNGDECNCGIRNEVGKNEKLLCWCECCMVGRQKTNRLLSKAST